MDYNNTNHQIPDCGISTFFIYPQPVNLKKKSLNVMQPKSSTDYWCIRPQNLCLLQNRVGVLCEASCATAARNQPNKQWATLKWSVILHSIKLILCHSSFLYIYFNVLFWLKFGACKPLLTCKPLLILCDEPKKAINRRSIILSGLCWLHIAVSHSSDPLVYVQTCPDRVCMCVPGRFIM